MNSGNIVYLQLYPNRFLSNLDDADGPEDVDSILAEYQRPAYPFQALERILAERYDDEDDIADGDDSYDDNINNGSSDDKLIGSRAKRLGFSYFPFRYTRQYILNQQNRVLPEILRAAHALRKGNKLSIHQHFTFLKYSCNFMKDVT